LLTGDRIVLGSDPACDVVLASDQVSRQHLELRRSGLIMHARDLGSTYRLMDAATDEELSDVRKPDGRA
jgi:hypothetical protein